MNLETISTQVSEHVTTLAQQIGHVLVALFLAVLILVIGLYISRWVGSYTKKWLGKFKFDEKTSKLGINELCVRFGLGKSPTYIIAFVLAWAVTFYSVVLAADVLHLTVLRDLFTRFLAFIPTLFVSVVILFAGLLVGTPIVPHVPVAWNPSALCPGWIDTASVYDASYPGTAARNTSATPFPYRCANGSSSEKIGAPRWMIPELVPSS